MTFSQLGFDAMIGTKIALVTCCFALIGVIDSDHVDAWSKLTALPILGAIVIALIYLHYRERRESRESTKATLDGLRESFDGMRDDVKGAINDMHSSNNDNQNRHIRLLEEHLDK